MANIQITFVKQNGMIYKINEIHQLNDKNVLKLQFFKYIFYIGVIKMLLLYVSLFFIVLVGILVLIYYLQTRKRHYNRCQKAEKFIEEYDGKLPLCLKNTYLIINQRRYEHIMTFFNFQLVNKVSGFLSVIFSLISFVSYILEFLDLKHSEYDSLACIAVSLLSILCVIVALYASPNRRVVEYITAWRIDERTINEITAELDTYKSLNEDEASEKAKMYLKRISDAEENIRSDED